MSKEKRIEEIRRDIFAAFGGYAKWEEDWQSLAEAVCNAGYRKQSEGEWVDQYQGMYVNQLYKCSVCGETAFNDDKRWFLTNYCPNCGAKMKGGAE